MPDMVNRSSMEKILFHPENRSTMVERFFLHIGMI